MAIINLTPDSFSADGIIDSKDSILAFIENRINQGADIIDVGAQSTKPGSDSISVDQEIERLSMLLPFYKNHFSVPLSLDTSKPEVAEYGLKHGVDIINDVSGGADVRMWHLVADYQCPYIVMHCQGEPKTMQHNPYYENVIADIIDFFQSKVLLAKTYGLETLVLDPGIGFGKKLEHNLKILQDLSAFKELGCPLMVGVSRKSFIGTITGQPIDKRLPGSIASNLVAVLNGANIVRVHDVAETVEALQVMEAIQYA